MKITAKNYVQFSSSLNFDGLLHILFILDQYDLTQLTDRFNLVVPISAKQQKTTVDQNNQVVIRKIYEAIQAGSYIGFDLFHRNTNDFISADLYKMLSGGIELMATDDIDPELLIKEAYDNYLGGRTDKEELFIQFFTGATLEAYREDLTLTSDSLLKHVSGEIQVDEKNYYMFYGEYYTLDKSYAERLNATLHGKLRQEYFIDELSSGWDSSQNEDDFNHNVSINEGYIHLHRTRPEQIEFADLLKIENNTATIIHVKDGFDCSMRELERQVELSIIRMLDLQNNNQELYMKKLYINGKNNKRGVNIKDHFQTEQDFVEKMKKCSFRYVIILKVDNQNLLASNSNIAKHCLNSLILKCFNRGVELKINLV